MPWTNGTCNAAGATQPAQHFRCDRCGMLCYCSKCGVQGETMHRADNGDIVCGGCIAAAARAATPTVRPTDLPGFPKGGAA